MPRLGPLAVWLDSDHVGVLEQSRRGELQLAYNEVARRRWPLGIPLVSCSMPLSLSPYRKRQAFPFFDGLLPEGEVRRMIAYDLGLDEQDTFGLLHALGRDCAGALVLQPVTEPPPRSPALGDAEPMTAEDVARRLAQLRSAPLGADRRVRVSLPGMQHKLLLTRLMDGSWALPLGAAPSTHILKPPIELLEGSVENEAFCMRLARRVGLEVANVAIECFGERSVLVVERFDRVVLPGHEVRRVHQEDICQAFSVRGTAKYEERGGPSLKMVAGLLRKWDAPADDIVRLLRVVTFTTVIGDADRHSKNITVFHREDGSIRLAPLYDVMCTRLYPSVSTVLGMFVNGKQEVDSVGVDDLVVEGMSWGLSEQTARDAVGGVLEALPEAVEAEAEASPFVPANLVEVLHKRSEARRTSMAKPPLVSLAPGVVTVAPVLPGRVWVKPYRRRDGTPVNGHWHQLPVTSCE
ncbi:MAG: HipA domain-containing protein [Actinomycetota bacterium]|jgi:serine/threonine-protein kinase HipA|nr:HipA domain-containing protein [Actinomycetota bacterium]